VRALDGVDFAVDAGQVHCLVGQNGAGKSTLIKCVAGLVAPTAGQVLMDGNPLPPGDPAAALSRGIATIYQELDLVDDLSVADNLFLGHELQRGPLLARREARRQASELLGRLGHPEVRPSSLVGSLPPASRQLVSIARALSRSARLLIMDEPTAVLGRHEVATLFAAIRRLTDEGVGVVYISHRLEEVAEVGDTITVLRDGRTVAAGLDPSTSRAELIAAMVGRQFAEVFPDRDPEHRLGPVVLRVDGLARSPVLQPVSFELRGGEVLGLGGLVGAGRTELLRLVAGIDAPTAGTVRLDDVRVPPGRPDAAGRAGIGLAPEERKSQGLWPGWDLVRNVSVADLRRFRRRVLLDRRAERAEAVRHLRSLRTIRPDPHPPPRDGVGRLRQLAGRMAGRQPEGERPTRWTPDPTRMVDELSGGNQQKVVLARWLLRQCRVLLLDEPTRGIDVEAKAEIYRVIRTLADGGIAVVLVSSELAELIGLCDRILVLAEGRPTALLDTPTTEAEVLAHALPRRDTDPLDPLEAATP
jgi:ribose transport system ATP-binding protein